MAAITLPPSLRLRQLWGWVNNCYKGHHYYHHLRNRGTTHPTHGFRSAKAELSLQDEIICVGNDVIWRQMTSFNPPSWILSSLIFLFSQEVKKRKLTQNQATMLMKCTNSRISTIWWRKLKKKYRNHSIADFWADRAKLWNRKMTNPKIKK